ncbi:MAG: aminotransferase class IV [Deltaproteobacteria bacterium]|nr:MAG: aminotransferase class IV [Deltaproteobacteria bacterium]
MELKRITKDSFFSHIASEKRPWQENYLAMYSSQWCGFVTDPDLMTVPIDDHLVHRGDGVFDVMRCVRGKIYQMEAHLQRLERSAKSIYLDLPSDYSQIRDIIKTLILAGGEKECLARVILSRGPGSFSTNPYECPSSQMYVVVIRYHSLPEKVYQKGIPIVTSRIPIKKSYFATIKSCNYLPNVLMKMEAIQAKCKYSVGLDEEGCLAEGSTENVGVVSRDGVLKFPGFEKTLAGITVKRIIELAEALARDGVIQDIRFEKIPLDEAYLCSEVMLFGTSINILPVVIFDGRTVGEGAPGPVYLKLSSLLWKDMRENKDLLTRLDWESK